METQFEKFLRTGDCLIGIEENLDYSNEKSFAYHLKQLTDPRKAHGKQYELTDVLCIVLWGYMANLTGIREIQCKAQACEKQTQLFSTNPGLSKIPSHQTISRILNLIDPDELDRAFTDWMNAIDDFSGEQLAIDGKSINALTDKAHGKKHPPYIVNVVDPLRMQLIKSSPIPEKRSEISEIPKVIRELSESYPHLIEGMTITTDALATKKGTFLACKEANVAYISPVKDKRTELYQNLQFQYEDHVKETIRNKEKLDFLITESNAHGRREKRIFVVAPVECTEENYEDICCVCYVVRYRKKHNGTPDFSVNKVLYQSTVMLSANDFSSFIMHHWYVEVYHNYLDMKLKKDYSTSKGNAFCNCSLLRKASVNLMLSTFKATYSDTYNRIAADILFNVKEGLNLIFAA